MQVEHWPYTQAVARKLAQEFGTPGLEQQLMICALKCVQPGFTFFEKKFWSELLSSVNAFEAARLFHPAKVSDLQSDATMVEELKYFYFLENRPFLI